ncbi:uncharacterized protein LOC110252583 [Exaiptasia diaphana]|uniref:Uncharacterized protein n=1 Tax=Exaiptasia diaphana TaxID=2652724 RepID=A0A913Y6D9_EXADI|nr:uncharacterized protein LOC110252583 [Exaiptasia diaphana]
MAEFALKGLAIASKLIESRIREQVLFDLKETDVVGQHFREFFIKQLEEIKEKLDGLARVDLLASLNFFKDGITLLNGHLDKVTIQDSSRDHEDTESFSSNLAKGLAALGFTTTMTGPDDAQIVGPDQTDSSFIVEAKEKFDKAIECAVKAISNDTLKLNDRIFAARLRMIGTILKHIDDNSISLTLCKSYIRQLNSIPEVLNNVRVHFNKGVGAAMRKTLYADERNELVWSVISINRVLWNYAHLCNVDSSYYTDWPLLDITDAGKIHPVLDAAVREMYSWLLEDNLSCPEGIAVAPNGCFVVADTLNECVKVFSSGGFYMFACKFPKPEIQDAEKEKANKSPQSDGSSLSVETDNSTNNPISFKPRCVTVTDEFTIFAGSSRGRREDHSMQAEVYIFNSDGDFVKSFGKEVFSVDSVLTSMAIDSSYGRLLISDDHAHCIHTFNLNGEYLSKLCDWEYHEGYSHIAVNQNGHILITHWDHVRIYDSEGKFASKFKTEYGIPLGGIAYDSARQQVYVLCKAYKHIDKNSKPNLQVCDKEWEPQGMIKLPKSYRSSKGIAVTPTGFVAVVNVDKNEVIVI